MKSISLSIELTEEERKKMAARYHFGIEELPRITVLYEALCPLLSVQAYFTIPEQQKEAEGQRVLCAVTLGQGIDALQELYSSRQAVSDAYILECLGGALLEKAYEKLGEQILAETGAYLNQYEFPGSHMPLERMGDILQELSDGAEDFPVTCSPFYLLQPKKSVVFAGTLGRQKGNCGICAGCSRKSCENRAAENYSYGYQRIFGNAGKGEKE